MGQTTSSPIERESIGSAAAGGAALGAVIALTLASTAVVPLMGAIIGAGGGAVVGKVANYFIQRGSHLAPKRASRDRASR